MRKNNARATVAAMTVVAAGAILLIGVRLAVAAKNTGGNQDIPVQVDFAAIHPDDASTTRVQADTPGVPYSDTESKITTRVGRNRTIWLNLSRPQRALALDLSQPVTCGQSVSVDLDGNPGCDPCDDNPPTLSTANPSVGLIDEIELTLVEGSNLDDIAVGTEHLDAARLRFRAGGDGWELWWGPYRHAGGFTSCPDSPPVLVTRVDNETWHVQTTGAHLACLYREENPPHLATEYHGQFALPFSATVTALESQSTPAGADPAARRVDGAPPCAGATCGDGQCDTVEDVCNCALDCGAPVDNDGDGFDACTDCDDDDPSVSPGEPEICDDGIDNDCDDAVDCADSECDGVPGCCVATHAREKGPRCNDGVDNDCDGLVDSDDPDC